MSKVTIEVNDNLSSALLYNKEVQWSRKNIFYIARLIFFAILMFLIFIFLLLHKEIVFMVISLLACLLITVCIWYLFYEYKMVKKILGDEKAPHEKNTYVFTEKGLQVNQTKILYDKINKVQQTKSYLGIYVEDKCYVVPYQEKKLELKPYMQLFKKRLHKKYIVYK